MAMTKRYFEISWPENHGPMWLNVDNLKALMFSRAMISGTSGVEVKDVTDKVVLAESEKTERKQ